MLLECVFLCWGQIAYQLRVCFGINDSVRGFKKKIRVSKSFCVCVVRDVLEMESLKRPSVSSLGDVLKTEFHKVDECVQ